MTDTIATETTTVAQLKVKILPNDLGNPPGKLADAEIHFVAGPLAGLKLIGFGIWERRGAAGRNVTFPARSYTVNGDRRSFALLRPIGTDSNAQERVRLLIVQAYEEYEEQTQAPATPATPARKEETEPTLKF